MLCGIRLRGGLGVLGLVVLGMLVMRVEVRVAWERRVGGRDEREG